MSGPDAGQDLRFEGFRVWTYRSIRDSGYVPVSPLTALVGREQSGKTTLLHALRGLEPRLEQPYSLTLDWPRGKNPRPAEAQVVCAAHFRFLPGMHRRLLDSGSIHDADHGVSVGRTYAGDFVFERWDGEPDKDRMLRTPSIDPAPEDLADVVSASLPEFLYAEHDARLPRTIPFAHLSAQAIHDDDSEANGVPAIARLLAAVGFPTEDAGAAADPSRLADAEEALIERLSAAGFPRDLRLQVADDHLALSLGHGRTRRTLDRVAPVDRFRLTLDVRVAAAMDPGGQPPVLLLDAPGRAFRGGFKRQLRPSLQAYADVGVTVVYSARLPFHVALQHPEQVLVLAPSQGEASPLCRPGSPRSDYTVTAALGMQGRSSFQIDDLNLVVEGPTDVDLLRAFDQLFERSDEPGLPPEINFVSAGGSYEVVAVATFLARQGLGVIALLDSDDAGATAAAQLAQVQSEESFDLPVQVLLLGQAAGLSLEHAVIEDVVAGNLYIEAARAACDPVVDEVIERALDGGVARWNGHTATGLARALAAQGLHLPKATIADALVARMGSMATVADLPAEMTLALRELFASIRAAAARLCEPESASSSTD